MFISFNCLFPGFVISAPDYPEQVVAECIEPADYIEKWSYEIWLKGRWSNTNNLSACIDPNLCYDDPPELPPDYSVNWNQTVFKPNTVNTTLNYTCARNCKFLDRFEN
jgi:hypothetical protein